MTALSVAVLTSLFPTPARPHEGLFAERRWLEMAARGHRVRIVHPRPWAPPAALARALGRGDWAEIAAAPARELRGGLPVERPRYVHLPGRARANARAFARRGVAAIEAGGRPDVVVADYAWPAAAAADGCRARGWPLVVSGRGSDVLEVAGEAGLREDLARCVRAAGHWCAVSADLVRALDELGGRPGHGVLVPNGVDLERFRPRDRVTARRELGLPADGTLVLCVGHLIDRKDPLLALEAFAAGAGPDARLVFVGRGPLETALRERADSLALARRVELRGELAPDDLASWYAAADALLLTSRREGRPNVVLEALASGRPVLATDAGGTRELLEGLPGCLATSREPRELGAALARLLASPPEPAVLRGSVAGLSWAASCERLEACLARAAGPGCPR